ncbi:MAG TPA: MmgE/PrpD family protein, partial [Candidatus Eremiobacteraceae bacterium]|nr:MmgE/PrpD family protein [Candidatus Eremiobacteraceae bacterium]
MLTRRSLFEFAGLAIATAALPDALPGTPFPDPALAKAPSTVDSAAKGVSPVMEKLSSYMSGAAARALPDDVVEKTKHHILDTLAAMISGSELTPGRAAIQYVRAYGGKEVATVVATNI